MSNIFKRLRRGASKGAESPKATAQLGSDSPQAAQNEARRLASEREAHGHAAESETRRQASDSESRRQAAENETRRQASDGAFRSQAAENEARHRAEDDRSQQ